MVSSILLQPAAVYIDSDAMRPLGINVSKWYNPNRRLLLQDNVNINSGCFSEKCVGMIFRTGRGCYIMDHKQITMTYKATKTPWNVSILNKTSMAYCKTAVITLLTHWSYCSLALSHAMVMFNLEKHSCVFHQRIHSCHNRRQRTKINV